MLAVPLKEFGYKHIFEVKSVLEMIEKFSREIISAEMKRSKMKIIQNLGIDNDGKIAKYDEEEYDREMSLAESMAFNQEYLMRCEMTEYICKVYKELKYITIGE